MGGGAGGGQDGGEAGLPPPSPGAEALPGAVRHGDSEAQLTTAASHSHQPPLSSSPHNDLKLRSSLILSALSALTISQNGRYF